MLSCERRVCASGTAESPVSAARLLLYTAEQNSFESRSTLHSFQPARAARQREGSGGGGGTMSEIFGQGDWGQRGENGRDEEEYAGGCGSGSDSSSSNSSSTSSVGDHTCTQEGTQFDALEGKSPPGPFIATMRT